MQVWKGHLGNWIYVSKFPGRVGTGNMILELVTYKLNFES